MTVCHWFTCAVRESICGTRKAGAEEYLAALLSNTVKCDLNVAIVPVVDPDVVAEDTLTLISVYSCTYTAQLALLKTLKLYENQSHAESQG